MRSSTSGTAKPPDRGDRTCSTMPTPTDSSSRPSPSLSERDQLLRQNRTRGPPRLGNDHVLSGVGDSCCRDYVEALARRGGEAMAAVKPIPDGYPRVMP